LAVYWCRIRLAWTDCSALNFIYFKFAVDIALATCISHKTRVIEFAVAVPKGLGNAKCVFYFFFPKAGKDVRCTETVDNHCLWLVWRSFTRHRLLLRCVEESEPVKCICRGIWLYEHRRWGIGPSLIASFSCKFFFGILIRTETIILVLGILKGYIFYLHIGYFHLLWSPYQKH
jgi:hypothetical protein